MFLEQVGAEEVVAARPVSVVVCSPVPGHAAELEAGTRRCLSRLRNALVQGVLPGAVGTRPRPPW